MMGNAMRAEHTLDNIKNITWDEDSNCLKVYLNNGNWWHYTTSEKWY